LAIVQLKNLIIVLLDENQIKLYFIFLLYFILNQMLGQTIDVKTKGNLNTMILSYKFKNDSFGFLTIAYPKYITVIV
jgi:hypothetical protein